MANGDSTSNNTPAPDNPLDVIDNTVDVTPPPSPIFKAPQEAAADIEGGKKFGISSESYGEMKEELEPVDESLFPPPGTPRSVVKRAIASNDVHSVMRPDMSEKPNLSKMNAIEKQVQVIGDSVKGTSIRRDMNKLFFKMARGQKLSADQEAALQVHQEDVSRLTSTQEAGFGFVESIPSDLAGSAVGLYESIEEQKGPLAKIGLGAAALGGFLGWLSGGTTGARIGATEAAKFAIGVSSAGAIAFDTMEQAGGNIYRELGATPLVKRGGRQGEVERRSISVGGGLLSGMIGFLPIGVIATKVPALKRRFFPRAIADRVNELGSNSFKKLLIDLGQSGLSEAIEEGSQEAIEIVTKAMGDTFTEEDTEASFLEGAGKALREWDQHLGRLAKAGALGFIGGAAIAGAGKAVSKVAEKVTPTRVEAPEEVAPEFKPKPSDIVGIQKDQTNLEKGIRTTKMAESFDNAVKIAKETSTEEHLPDEMNGILQDMFDEQGFSHVFISKEKLDAWADSDEKKADVNEMLTESHIEDAIMDVDLQIDSSTYADLVRKHEDAVTIIKPDPEGMSAQDFADLHEELINPPAEGPSESIAKTEDVVGEQPYLEQETSREVKEARQEVVDSKGEQLELLEVKPLREHQRDAVADTVEQRTTQSDSNMKLVEDYLSNFRLIQPLTIEQQKRFDKGQPVYAINPATLTNDQRNKYVDDPVLKKRKVFSTTGEDVNTVSELFGAVDNTQMLEILSKTLTRDQAIKAAEKSGKAQAERPTPTNAKLVKAYRKLSAGYINAFRGIVQANPEFKNKVPDVNKLGRIAKDRIREMRVKDLRPNKYKVAERKAQRKSLEARIAKDVEGELTHTRTSALVTQLAKESHVAIGEINKAFDFIAKINDPEVRTILKDAGRPYENAVNTLLSLYNFDSTKDGKARVGDYNKFADKMAREGKGDFRIDPETAVWLQPKTDIDQMTVNQVLFLSDKLQDIVKQASLSHELLAEAVGIENKAIEIIADELHQESVNHPSYDLKRLSDPRGDIPWYKSTINFLRTVDAGMTNLNFFMQKADNDIVGGTWSKRVLTPLVEGLRNKVKLATTIRGDFEKLRTQYGKKDFVNLGVKRMFIPEFGKIDNLNNGKLTKADVIGVLLNMGNAENQTAVSNYGLDPANVMKILKRHLDKRDFDLAQGMWDIFEGLKPKVDELEQATTGKELDFVEPESFEAFDKQYRGGYYPLRYIRDSEMDAMIEEQQSLLSDDQPPTYPVNAYRGIVKSNHTKERVGSKWQVDPNLGHFSTSIDEVIHDLVMRVPVRDVSSLLADKTISTDLTAILGKIGAKEVRDLVAEQTNSTGVRNIKLFENLQKQLDKFSKSVENGFAVNRVLFSLDSVFMTSMALPQIINKMGAKNSAKYLFDAALKTNNLTNMQSMRNFRELAKEIDPTVDAKRAGIDEFKNTAIGDLVPKDRIFKNETYNIVKRSQEAMTEFGFGSILGGLDAKLKEVVGIAAYNQYRGGDAPGHPTSKVFAMTEAEQHRAAKDYAEQFSASVTMRAEVLSKAPIQKIPFVNVLTRFWNESRNALNNVHGDVRRAKVNVNKAVAAAKEGDIETAHYEMYGAGFDLTRLYIAGLFSVAIMNFVRGGNFFADPEDEKRRLPLGRDLAQGPEWVLSKMTPSGAVDVASTLTFGNIIGVRDWMFAAETETAATVPAFQAVTDVAKAGSALSSAMADVRDGANLSRVLKRLTTTEQKALLNTVGYFVGGIPVNMFYRNGRYFENLDGLIPKVGSAVGGAVNALEGLVKDSEEELTEDEKIARDFATIAAGGSLEDQQVNQAKQIANQLKTPKSGEQLSKDDMEVIKYTESNNNWKARPFRRDKKGKPVRDKEGNLQFTSSAFGLYQFTTGTWDRIMNHPGTKKLGLTKRGRTSRDSAQQEKAARFLMNENAKDLTRDNVPLNIETLYYAWHFGSAGAAKVYNSPEKTKIKSILSKKVLAANPALVKNKVKTAGDMKKHIRRLLDRGRKAKELDKR